MWFVAPEIHLKQAGSVEMAMAAVRWRCSKVHLSGLCGEGHGLIIGRLLAPHQGQPTPGRKKHGKPPELPAESSTEKGIPHDRPNSRTDGVVVGTRTARAVQVKCDNGLASFKQPHHVGCVSCEAGFEPLLFRARARVYRALCRDAKMRTHGEWCVPAFLVELALAGLGHGFL